LQFSYVVPPQNSTLYPFTIELQKNNFFSPLICVTVGGYEVIPTGHKDGKIQNRYNN